MQLLDALFQLKLQPAHPESQDLSDISGNNVKRLHSKAPDLVELSCKSLNNLALQDKAYSFLACPEFQVTTCPTKLTLLWHYDMLWHIFSGACTLTVGVHLSRHAHSQPTALQHMKLLKFQQDLLVLCQCYLVLLVPLWIDLGWHSGGRTICHDPVWVRYSGFCLRTTVREFENRHSQALQPFPTHFNFDTLH